MKHLNKFNKNSQDMENKVLNYFLRIYKIDDFLDCCLYNGIYEYKIEPNNGVFGKDFISNFIKSLSGDSDIDYMIGKIGYGYLLSDKVQKIFNRNS